MTFEEKVKIKKAFEQRKELITQGIEDCINDKMTLKRLRARLEELELWEEYILKQ